MQYSKADIFISHAKQSADSPATGVGALFIQPIKNSELRIKNLFLLPQPFAIKDKRRRALLVHMAVIEGPFQFQAAAQ